MKRNVILDILSIQGDIELLEQIKKDLKKSKKKTLDSLIKEKKNLLEEKRAILTIELIEDMT